MNHQPIIRHPDLSRLSEKQLMNELKHFELWSKEIWLGIQRGLEILSHDGRLSIPIWKLQHDLQCAIDRQAAILEELNYRDIP